MYQAVAYNKRTNIVHVWDDQKGHVQIKYKPYAYRKATYGKLVALDGQTVEKVYNPGDEQGLYENDLNPETLIFLIRTIFFYFLFSFFYKQDTSN